MFIKKRFLTRRTRRPHRSIYRPRLRKGFKGFLGGRKFILVLLMISLFIATILFLYPPGAGLSFNSVYIKAAITEKIFPVDYLRLITNSLPGLGPADAIPDQGADLPLKPPLWRDYPRLILSNELAGLTIPGAAKVFVPSAAGESSGIFNDEAGGGKGFAFLAEEMTGYPGEKPIISEDSKPLLLIYHTHASESFLPVSGETFSADPDQTVVFFGAALAKMLRDDYCIPVLHHREVYDRPRRTAYQKAGPAVEKILQQNPQIEVVIDLHRDGAPHKITTASVAGQNAARTLFVIGTRHEDWSGNLRFALFLENLLQEKHPGFSRGILKNNYDYYNQHLHPRSLIVEIGGHENNKEELLGAIPCLAEVLADAFE